MLNIDYVGCNYVESKSFTIDRPNGSRDYLFLLFSSDIHITIKGRTAVYPPGTGILYTPYEPQLYRNPLDGFTNDWIHFSAEPDFKFCDEISIKTNQPFQIDNFNFIRQLIFEIENEYLMKDKNTDLMIDLLIKQLMIQVSRNICAIDNHKSAEQNFRKSRSIILSRLDYPWTIDEMAKLTNLSRSRYTHIYKSIFNISPKEDLNNERMALAKHLIKNGSYKINEIGRRVGYDNPYHFSKQFKIKFGCSPKEYYKTRLPCIENNQQD